MSDIPKDFGLTTGEKPGTPISNKDSILAEVDSSLGQEKPPDLEYILVRPFSRINFPLIGYGISYNTFGHSAVRYTLPTTGEQFVVNIEGNRSGKNIVQFRKPTEFFYGTDPNLTGEQLALYNRSMITVRVNDLQAEKILAMHNYFLSLQKDFEEGKKNFFIAPLHHRDLISKIYPRKIIQYGNCARWTSEGLQKAGVITHKSYWPKAIWINMFESYLRTSIGSRSNMSVVSYRLVEHAHHKYGNETPGLTLVAPLQTFRTFSYFNLEKFANRIIEVPSGSVRAEIQVVDSPQSPSNWRNFLNTKFMIGLSSAITGMLIARQTGLFAGGRYLWRMTRARQINRRNAGFQINMAKVEARNFRIQQKQKFLNKVDDIKKEFPTK